jgi:beta-lactam-binding protein with PASTA domain
VGLSIGEARAILVQQGFEVLVTEQPTADQPPGVVVFQAPPAGTEVAAGTRVAITVATAPEPTPTPTPTPRPTPTPEPTPQATGQP